MDESHLYEQIADSIRSQVHTGVLKPGDRLPPLREMAGQWRCTVSTVQHAYRLLAEQKLIASRPGQGTRVLDETARQEDAVLRRMSLLHRSEAFLLESISSGYRVEEVESAIGQALNRWRTVVTEPSPSVENVLRFAGSHDLALTWIVAHFGEIAPSHSLQPAFSGSLGGLIALAQNNADLAGCHLWDRESDTYNLPFVRRLLPGRRVALLTLAHRRMGWIVPPGNPAGVRGLSDLLQPQVRFVNRQPGSGTRVWLDAALSNAGIPTREIAGFDDERMTHSEVARAIAAGEANVGFGLEAAARAFGLEFIFQLHERYDLVLPDQTAAHPALLALRSWLVTSEAQALIRSLGGYDTQETGALIWVE